MMRDIEDILVDYFAGEELSTEESRLLEEWKEEREHARLLNVLQEMRGGREESRKLKEDPGKGMRVIQKRIRVRRKKTKRMFIASVAACLAIVLGTLLYYFREDSDKIVPTTELATSKAFARLKLADGREVTLRADRDEVIVADSFSTVKNSNSTVIYDEKTIGKRVEYHTLAVPVGAEYNLVLSDGTKVYLNAGSELRFPVVFTKNTREVYLNGEGYFEVAKDSTKAFKVHTADMTTIVLGTSFNMKAYSDQKHMETTLEEGHVRVLCGQQEFDMYPGNQVRYDRLTREAVVKKVDTKYYTSWKDGYYSFNEMPLEEVMEILAKWYDLRVFYVDDEVKKYEFSGRLKRYEDFTYLLNKFEETGVVEFVIKDNVITIQKK